MATIVTRAGKGSTLTFTEVDDNFTNLNAVASDTLVTAKGDLIVASAADTVIRVAIDSNGKVLTADSGAASGVSWQTPAATAAAITNTPAGGIAATNVQDALNELDTEKAPLASPTLTGVPLAPTAAPLTNNTQIATTEYVDDAVAAIPAETVATDTIWATKGDLVAATGNDAAVVVPVGTDGYVLTADSGETAGVSWQEPGTTSAPTVQTFTSGSGTYTKPAGCTRIHVKMVGGGGGGSGGYDNITPGSAGGNGGNTTFGAHSAGGGAGAGVGNGAHGTAGAASLGAGAIGAAIIGAKGGEAYVSTSTDYQRGAMGADSPYFGGGGQAGGADRAGGAGSTNTGGGGGGGGTGTGATRTSGGGGGSGGYCDFLIPAPSSTYSYAVGAAGTAGTAGTNGQAGGAGAAGQIIVTEYYGNFDSVLQLNEPASTKQEFTSGSGTYTTPAGVNRIKVSMVGAGGGGSGGGTTPGAGGNGGTTTFGSSLLTANGGNGAAAPGNYPAGGGGGTVSAPAVGFVSTGGSAQYPGTNAVVSSGGQGGGSFYGSGGGSAAGAAGLAGGTNLGAGGGGGGSGSTVTAGNGGGAGGYVEAWIWSPSATYAYSVGTAGTAGTAGTSGFAGGAGSAGRIIVEEFYGPTNTVADTVPTGGYRRNKLRNSSFNIANRGTSFDSATTNFPNNDAAILLDGWRILSDGNDVVDVTQNTAAVPTAPGAKYCMALDVETANKKFGAIQVIENQDCFGLIGAAATFSFKAKVSVTTNLDNVKAAVIYWTGTADAPTADVISAWGVEGTDPTLVASWAYASAPANLGVTTNWGTYTVAANIPSTATNVAVLVWSDVTTTSVGTVDLLYVTDCQLEQGSVRTQYERLPIGEEEDRCARYLPTFKSTNTTHCLGMGTCSATITAHVPVMFPVRTRVLPTGIVVSAASHFQVTNAAFAANVAATAVASLAYMTPWAGTVTITTASGLVADKPTMLSMSSVSGYLIFTGAEL